VYSCEKNEADSSTGPISLAKLPLRKETPYQTAAIVDQAMLHSSWRAWAHFGPQVLFRTLACRNHPASAVTGITVRCDLAAWLGSSSRGVRLTSLTNKHKIQPAR